MIGLLDYLADVRVPHNFFTHFYVVSVLCSLFWGWLLFLKPEFWANGFPNHTRLEAMTEGQLQLVWFLMLLQGVRRLLESYTYTSKSKSGMWFGHWILGLVFYLTINVAIWIEGASGPPRHVRTSWSPHGSHPIEEKHPFQLKVAVFAPAILICHGLQHEYHAYLYRLRTEKSTYQLPSHPLFSNLLCPHYTCEILIYLLLSSLGAPAGRLVNWTLASATVFVVVNLGVTAYGTKEWYQQRFGADQVIGRRRMIPWVW